MFRGVSRALGRARGSGDAANLFAMCFSRGAFAAARRRGRSRGGDRDQWPPGKKKPGTGAFFETEERMADYPAGFHILRAAFFTGCRLVHVAPPNFLQTANLDR